jgi:hypothetical protein
LEPSSGFRCPAQEVNHGKKRKRNKQTNEEKEKTDKKKGGREN